jgi:hypothetical protein
MARPSYSFFIFSLQFFAYLQGRDLAWFWQ